MDRVMDFLTPAEDDDGSYTVYTADSEKGESKKKEPKAKFDLMQQVDKHVLTRFGCSMDPKYQPNDEEKKVGEGEVYPPSQLDTFVEEEEKKDWQKAIDGLVPVGKEIAENIATVVAKFTKPDTVESSKAPDATISEENQNETPEKTEEIETPKTLEKTEEVEESETPETTEKTESLEVTEAETDESAEIAPELDESTEKVNITIDTVDTSLEEEVKVEMPEKEQVQAQPEKKIKKKKSVMGKIFKGKKSKKKETQKKKATAVKSTVPRETVK